MTHLYEHEPSGDDTTAERLGGFGVRDWMEAILACGINGTVEGERVRLMPWYEPMTETQYLLKRAELRASESDAPISHYLLQVNPLIDSFPRQYLYGTDTRRTIRCDVGGRVLGPGEACYQYAEAELLTHLRTAPSYTWPRIPRRLPDNVVETVFAQRYTELFGSRGLQYKTSWWIADIFRRLRWTGYERRKPQ